MALDALIEASAENVPTVSLAAMWSVVGALGFTPSLASCAVDGRALPDGGASFSVAEGGFLCDVCRRSRHSAELDERDRHALQSFVEGTLPSHDVPAAHAAAHRRLLAHFVRRHVAEERALPAMDFWEKAR
jgi:recombinational DNA repair protein (RecF pathway)